MAEMKLNQVPRWRYLADCIEFLRIEESPQKTEKFEFLPTEDLQMNAVRDDHVDFKLTTRAGKQIPIQGRETWQKQLGAIILIVCAINISTRSKIPVLMNSN